MALTPAAYAQNAGQNAENKCAGDIARLCPNVQPGEGRVAECLKAQKSQVSFRCKRALMKAKEAKEAQAAAAAQAAPSPAPPH